MEAIVKKAIQQFCEENNILQDFQHGFRRGRSCLSNLLSCLDIWTRALEEGFEVDVVYIDFRKAFDTVPHQRLLHKLSDMGIRGDLLNWIRAFLVGRKQRVCIGDDMSEWVNVTGGVPQGSVLGPLLFILYVNDSLKELDCGKIMFADDVKLWQVIKVPNDQRSLQDNLHRLQAWSKKWLLDFNVEKCAVLHLRPTNSHSNESLRTYHLKDKRLPAESSQKDLGTDVYAAWNKGGRLDVYELEAAFTRRLKRSLDALRKRRSRPDSLIDDSDEPSTEPTSSRPRKD
nr:unnamed protein product [Spirometra erinaceieuropaei]